MALLNDNCSAYSTVDFMVALNNAEVLFLPLNRFPENQPMDAGVTASVKMRYRSAHMDQAADLMEEDVSDIYKIDILLAMRALRRTCVELSRDIIKQCWSHPKISPATAQLESATNLESSLESERPRLEE